MKCIWDYSKDELAELMSSLNQPSFRSKQLYEWLYVHQVTDYNAMTNLSKATRATLKEIAPIEHPVIQSVQISEDGTRKYAIKLHDGNLVETVAIPSLSNDRLTVCFSTQVGCAMECLFCATGTEGFTRNLSQGEIVLQILLAQQDFGRRVTNLVAMGQGEPFFNYEQLIRALRILNDKNGFAIGARHITVSTCGICREIERFTLEPEQYTLAVSLHSAIQRKRNMLMPHLSGQPLTALKNSLLYYSKNKGRRISLEYLLLQDVNDKQEDLQALIEFCNGLFCHVNLLPLNPIEGNLLQPSSIETRNHWIAICESNGIEATARVSRGSDIDGACGQLKSRIQKGGA